MLGSFMGFGSWAIPAEQQQLDISQSCDPLQELQSRYRATAAAAAPPPGWRAYQERVLNLTLQVRDWSDFCERTHDELPMLSKKGNPIISSDRTVMRCEKYWPTLEVSYGTFGVADRTFYKLWMATIMEGSGAPPPPVVYVPMPWHALLEPYFDPDLCKCHTNLSFVDELVSRVPGILRALDHTRFVHFTVMQQAHINALKTWIPGISNLLEKVIVINARGINHARADIKQQQIPVPLLYSTTKAWAPPEAKRRLVLFRGSCTSKVLNTHICPTPLGAPGLTNDCEITGALYDRPCARGERGAVAVRPR